MFNSPDWSHPAWGAWIEIGLRAEQVPLRNGRTPHGVRGLKYELTHSTGHSDRSHPAWGAWIEIVYRLSRVPVELVAPRMGCVD